MDPHVRRVPSSDLAREPDTALEIAGCRRRWLL